MQQCSLSLKNQKTQVWNFGKLYGIYETETQNLANLLTDTDNESSKNAMRKWCVINDQDNTEYGEGNEMSQALNSKSKLLNQIVSIIQMHIFL